MTSLYHAFKYIHKHPRILTRYVRIGYNNQIRLLEWHEMKFFQNNSKQSTRNFASNSFEDSLEDTGRKTLQYAHKV